MERNPQLPDGQGRRRHRGGRRERRQDHRQREQEQQRAGDRHRAEQGRLHGRSAGRRPPGRGQGASTAIASGMEDSINTYYFFMNTEKRAVQRHQGPPGHQLRHRPRGAQPDLRRPAAPVAADPAAGHARLPGVQALPRTGHEQGETAYRRGQSGRQGHHRLDRRRARPQADRRVLPRPAHPAGLQRHTEGDCGRRLLDDDRQPVDTRRGHRLRRLVPGLPASGRLLPSAAARRQHPADQRQQLLAGQHPRQQRQDGRAC